MPEIIFKKRRGAVADMFNVLCMYSVSPSLRAILKSYQISVDPYLHYSYEKICSFIDDNVKMLKPFFVKNVNSPDEGSIFHKMTQMIMIREDLLIKDVLAYFRKMRPEYFLAEFFRITDEKPESMRREYLRIVRDRQLTKEFLARQNFTVREVCAIKAFHNDLDFEYECFIDFIEKLYAVVEREHNRNSEQIMRYTDWLQYRFNPKHKEYIFNNPEITLDKLKDCEKIITTVSLFPPYSCNRLFNGKNAIVCFGVGAFMPYARKCYTRQDVLKNNLCEMRENVLRVLLNGPIRLLDIAECLHTSSADVKYHLGVLEKNGFIKRVRVNERELFSLNKAGIEFAKEKNVILENHENAQNCDCSFL